jgi:hypothetical protein
MPVLRRNTDCSPSSALKLETVLPENKGNNNNDLVNFPVRRSQPQVLDSVKDESNPHLKPISLRSILILSSDLYLRLQIGIFASGSNQNVVCISHFLRACYMPSPSNASSLEHPNNVWCKP